MALIKCPECGRENVSDTAEACPGCGYGIRKHFEKEMQQREAKEKQNKIEKEKFVTSAISDKDKKIFKDYASRVSSLDSYQMKEREDTIKRLEKEISGEIRTKAIASIVGIVSFILMIVCYYYSEDGSLGVLVAIFFCITGFCVGGLYASRGSVEEMQKNLRIARSDYEKYKKDIEEWNRREAERLLMEDETGVRCPYCHSTNTTKISSFSKGVSVAVLGDMQWGKFLSSGIVTAVGRIFSFLIKESWQSNAIVSSF